MQGFVIKARSIRAAVSVLLAIASLLTLQTCGENDGGFKFIEPGFYIGEGSTSQGGNISFYFNNGITTLYFQILSTGGCAGLPEEVNKKGSPLIEVNEDGSFSSEIAHLFWKFIVSGVFDGTGKVVGKIEVSGRSCLIEYLAEFDPSSYDSDLDGVPDEIDPNLILECGNGTLDESEECDEGVGNSNAPNASCRTNCTNRRCGDGILDNSFGEACDDGNTQNGDGCSAGCAIEGSETGAYVNGTALRSIFD